MKPATPDTIVYVPVKVEDELPPFNQSIICFSEDYCIGQFNYLGGESWNDAILNHGITHWLKPITISELINQTMNE